MLITEDNAVFISSLLDPHAEHLVNLPKKSQLPRSITRGVGLLELFPWSFWGEEQFWYVGLFHSWSLFGNGSEISLSGGTVKKHPVLKTAYKRVRG